MKSMLLKVLVLTLIGPLSFAQAQSEEAAKTKADTTDLYPNWQNKHAIALSGGLPGFGLEYAYNINRRLNIRAGFLAFQLNDYNTDMEVNGQDINLNANLSAGTYDLHLEYQPSSQSSFKLVAGLSYLNNVGVNTLILLNNDMEFGDLTIDNEEIGDIDMTITWSGLAPYLGLGFGRAVPKKRVGFGFEIGSYYAGGPDVQIDASGMLENTNEEEAEMEENLASYAWVPRVMARLAIKL